MIIMTKETKVTSKYQTSIPKEVRKLLDIKIKIEDKTMIVFIIALL